MPKIVDREKWISTRMQLLEQEKSFDRQRDLLAAKRREMPWVLVDTVYKFATRKGSRTLAELFGSHTQLIIYHFMYGEDWEDGCPSCSFWADNFDGIDRHLAARDAAFAVVSIAPLEKLLAYQKRMGWDFNWVSSHGNSFNRDFNVTFSDEDREKGTAIYNYKKSTFPGNEAPGVSVFAKGDQGKVYHTYSTYARGLDMLNGAYHYMDILPKGRDEGGLDYPMAWVKRHDVY